MNTFGITALQKTRILIPHRTPMRSRSPIHRWNRNLSCYGCLRRKRIDAKSLCWRIWCMTQTFSNEMELPDSCYLEMEAASRSVRQKADPFVDGNARRGWKTILGTRDKWSAIFHFATSAQVVGGWRRRTQNEPHHHGWFLIAICALTSAEVDDDVYEEDGVWETVKGNPPRAKIIIEERDGNWQDDKVCY